MESVRPLTIVMLVLVCLVAGLLATALGGPGA